MWQANCFKISAFTFHSVLWAIPHYEAKGKSWQKTSLMILSKGFVHFRCFASPIKLAYFFQATDCFDNLAGYFMHLFYDVQRPVSNHLGIMHLQMQHQLFNTYTRAHTRVVSTYLKMTAIEWKYRTLLIHNAERIYGNCTLTVCLCDADQQSCCCSSVTASLCLF